MFSNIKINGAFIGDNSCNIEIRINFLTWTQCGPTPRSLIGAGNWCSELTGFNAAQRSHFLLILKYLHIVVFPASFLYFTSSPVLNPYCIHTKLSLKSNRPYVANCYDESAWRGSFKNSHQKVSHMAFQANKSTLLPILTSHNHQAQPNFSSPWFHLEHHHKRLE